MGIIRKITDRVLGSKSSAKKEQAELLRRCYFEVMEERRVLSANPVVAGITYREGDGGLDTQPDYFEVSFQGGSEKTQMTQFSLNGDLDKSGTRNFGDIFFDTTGLGAGGQFPFQFDAARSSGISAGDILGFTVSPDGLQLSVNVKNFEAGDILAFTIDVDEMENLRPDMIVSGVEIEGTLFQASFADDNYTFNRRKVELDVNHSEGFVQRQWSGVFFDDYDAIMAEGGLIAGKSVALTSDNANGQANRTAGTIDVYELVPKPVTISGTVYHDVNSNCLQESTEQGIANVNITLQRLDETTGQYVNVAQTTTNAQGKYNFGADLNLQPGTFRVIQDQPADYLSVGAKTGSHGGQIGNNTNNEPNVIGSISIPLGGTAATNYDFCEVKPVTISGNVYHDEDADCDRDANEVGIGNVNVRLQRLNEAGQYVDVASTKTDAQGRYTFGPEHRLRPGTFRLVEDQPTGFLSVGSEAGSHGGVVSKTGDNHPNIIGTIQIPLGGSNAVNYDFCEIKPASISGHVWHDQNDNGVFEPTEQGISGVLIQVTRVGAKEGTANDAFADTNPIFVRTDAKGHYSVQGLPPGMYQVVEINDDLAGGNPLASYIDGKDSVGNVASETRGLKSNDKFTAIELCAGDAGVKYDFGELRPASLSGYVSLTDPDGNCVSPDDPTHVGLGGVRIELYDSAGKLVASTQTNSSGKYEFVGLVPGNYSVVEIQPTGYLDAGQSLGTVKNSAVGTAANDKFSNIVLGSSDAGVMYNFCETPPAEICGTVWHDQNDDGVMDANEERIPGTVVQLFDANGNKIAETTTDAQGAYCFTNLFPGEYCVKEIQPNGFVDGKDVLGSVTPRTGSAATRGEMKNDEFCKITLRGGEKGTNYNFGELKLAEISGYVHTDNDRDCIFDRSEGDKPLAGVTLELLDKSGNILQTTTTDQNGAYAFKGLLPGEYSVRQIQPNGYFTSGEKTGSGTGSASKNLLTGIKVMSGDRFVEYNFCECETSEIHGRVWEDGPAIATPDGTLPANYRSLRDGVYDASVDTPIAGTKMYLYFYVSPESAGDPDVVELAMRPVTLADVLPEFYGHMNTTDSKAPVWTTTDSEGKYNFLGLKAGSYVVLQQQPEGYFDSNDTPGTTTGFSYNSVDTAKTAPQNVLRTFNSDQIMNSIVNIQVQAGGTSQENNFSEVRVVRQPISDPPPVVPPIDTPLPRLTNPTTPTPGMTGFPGLNGAASSAFPLFAGPPEKISFQFKSQAGSDPYSWHLSVINAGDPRNVRDGLESRSAWQQVGYLTNNDWNRFDMNEAVWTFANSLDKDRFTASGDQLRFGMFGGTPLAGDFDGDGKDQMAVFNGGYWMIDLNANGLWDEKDLLIKLGDEKDRPVVGDWDGDGKDDIGIYGPMWEHDPDAIAQEPGLPNPANRPNTRPKNVPPNDHEATNRARVMKLTTFGEQRADVVDHVFGIGDGSIIPIAGDWNGNGIRSIGTFKDGTWQLDLNGDGKFDHRDTTARFGQAGDVPVIGDFNGDGIDQIAVFRAGTWIVDSNGNREIDATDFTFQMGESGDKPVAGDWNGDGKDQPAVYRGGKNEVVF